MKSVRTMSTWRDVVKRDRCRDRLAAVKSCNRPSYRVACKRTVVNRNCLTRSEHTEMLSTPKGYLWTGARGLRYVLMRDCQRMDGVRRRRRHAKTAANDANAMWQEFVKQFLQTTKDMLSLTTKTILPKILMSKKIVSDPKWSNRPNTQAKLCSFFSDLNPECSSSKWKQDFLQSLSSLIFDYIVQVLYCDRITKKNKLLTREILQNINNITQEHGPPQPSSDSLVRGVQIFVANVLSPWLAESTTDFCQGVDTGLLIKSNINNEFRDQEPNKRRARNGSKKIYYRPRDKTPVVSTSHHGHKNKLQLTKKIDRVKSKSNANETDVNEATNNVPRKADNGLEVQDGNRSETKGSTDVNENRLENDRENNDVVIDTDQKNSGETISMKSDSLRMLNGTVKREKASGTNDKKTNKKTVGKRSKSKNVPRKNGDKRASKSKIRKRKNNASTLTRAKSKSIKSEITNGKSSDVGNSDEAQRRSHENELKTQHDRKDDTIGNDSGPSNGELLLERKSQIEYDDTYDALDDNEETVRSDDESTNEESNVNEDGLDNVIGTDQGNRDGTIAVGSDDRANNPDDDIDDNDGDIDKPSMKSRIGYDDAYALDDDDSVNREPDVNENRLENDDVMDADRENRGETIAVGSDDRANSPDDDDDDNGNGNSDDIDDGNNNRRTPSTMPEEDGRVDADQLHCTRSYDDIRAETEFESCVSDEMNAFLKKLSTSRDGRVTATTDKFGELKEICYQSFSNNTRTRSAVDETGNKVSADDQKRGNRNPGIVYRICKKDGSNYSVRKTILPTRENGDPTFAADDPAVKGKLIMRKINEVDNVE